MITIDRYTHSVTEYFELKKYNTTYNKRTKWYNRKTYKSASKAKRLISYMYENKTPKERLYFVTITTCQHKNNLTDKQLSNYIYLWLKNRGLQYVNVAERQQNGDIHFHLVIKSTKDFDFKIETKKLATYFNVEYHPALFDVKRVKDQRKLASYITKYITKEKKEFSSLFTTRIFRFSQNLTKDYKKNAYKSTFKVPSSLIESYQHLFVSKYKNDFTTIYEYNLDIWKVAQSEKSKFLKQLN